MKCFFDTESVQFQGPTILIQYQFDDGPIVLHNIFSEPVQDTLDLIDKMMTCHLIGFNLVHDMFHLARTYNILQFVKDKESLVTTKEYFAIEEIYGETDRPLQGKPSIYDLCLKPTKALDLMIWGRESVFQATMGQKPVIIRKFPAMLAHRLLAELESRVQIDPIYFGRSGGKPDWKIETLLDNGYPDTKQNRDKYPSAKPDPDLVNIKLSFKPSTSLKNIARYILGKKVLEYESPIKNIKEKPYAPIKGDYKSVISAHIDMWEHDTRQRQYATDDVINTRGVYDWLTETNGTDDYNSTNHDLAVLVGNSYWSGYPIDKRLVKELLISATKKRIEASGEVEYNSPKQSLTWLREVANPIMAKVLDSTDKKTLDILVKREDELGRRARVLREGRSIDKEVDLLKKLDEAGRFHASFKVLGTKSNRMAGGALVSTKGSINPQGISKKDLRLRECFIFKDFGQQLEGGDFAGFEVAIMEAVYGDENLRKQLLTGRKFHAIFGAFMYGMTYEEVLADKALYNRAKSGVFGWAYGAQPPKIAETLGIEVADATKGFNHMEKTYPGIGKAKLELYRDFEAMTQPKGMGTAVEWKEPKQYVESFLGFRRYFTMEYRVIKALFDLAMDLPNDFKVVKARVNRRKDKSQTVMGGARSALYSGAFGIQSAILRVCSNHKIQSPGGQMTKELQAKFFELQPIGATKWLIKPFNVHDEVQLPVAKELVEDVRRIRDEYIEYRKPLVPLLEMDWNEDAENWRESH